MDNENSKKSIIIVLVLIIFVLLTTILYKSGYNNGKKSCLKSVNQLVAENSAQQSKIDELNLDLGKCREGSLQLPTPWACGVNGIYTPTRLNKDDNGNGGIECLTYQDGETCLWGDNVDSCQKLIETNVNGPPRKCRINEYEDPNSWCSKVLNSYVDMNKE